MATEQEYEVQVSCATRGRSWGHVCLRRRAAEGPFVATTDTDGGFVIDHVPEGTYPLKMWHEGVQLKQILTSLQRYEYEDPYEQTQQVTVSSGKETVVNFALELRPQS